MKKAPIYFFRRYLPSPLHNCPPSLIVHLRVQGWPRISQTVLPESGCFFFPWGEHGGDNLGMRAGGSARLRTVSHHEKVPTLPCRGGWQSAPLGGGSTAVECRIFSKGKKTLALVQHAVPRGQLARGHAEGIQLPQAG